MSEDILYEDGSDVESPAENNGDDFAEETVDKEVCQPRKKRKAGLKVTATWPHDDIIRLIRFAEVNPCVWNVSLPEYKDRERRTAAWGQIAKFFNYRYSPKECTAKWQVLRSTQRRILKDHRKSGQGTEPSKPRWQYYDDMLFVTAAEGDYNTMSDTNLLKKIFDCGTIADSVGKTDPVTPIQDSSSELGVARQRTSRASTPTTNRSQEKEKMRKKFQSTLNRMVAIAEAPIQPADEFEVFGQFIASELRALPDKNAARRLKTQMNIFLCNKLVGMERDVDKGESFYVVADNINRSNPKVNSLQNTNYTVPFS